jgi:plastocyanin
VLKGHRARVDNGVDPARPRRARSGRKGFPNVRALRNLQRATVLLAFATLVAPAAIAGTIRGTIHVPERAGSGGAHMQAYAGSAGAMPGMHGPVHGRVTDAVVYVATVPADVESTLAAIAAPRPKLAQKDECFLPRVVPVAVGTAVDFPNLDPIYHNVFSLSPVKRFDLGKYPRGQSKAVVFNRIGLVNVFCDIHSEMAAFVLVLPHHAFVQPKADGTFELPDLPAGKYELHVWHPDLTEIVRTVDLPAQGDARVDLSF